MPTSRRTPRRASPRTVPVPHPPRLDLRAPADLLPGELRELVVSQHAEGLRFTEQTLTGEDLTGARLVECELLDVELQDVALTGATVAESRLVRLTSPHLAAARSTWRAVEILGSRVGVAELHDAGISELRIADSKLDLVNLRSASLTDVVLDGCTLTELDLGAAKVRRMQVRDCGIGTLDLTGADLQHVDLRGARVSRIVGLAGLRGTTISPEQLMDLAPAFAEHLGLDVQD
ncbi:pentapeptide repeat-containing protein [Nesterenkonia xinjiangensis]|uniref:Uncharacterized protein YjbI with pentapeptide repeats n=1 Tax=Nesterenkonia xinjiangensis TaxID=225327 RepID=A0A7Z0K841_9MICC|nr:pentapeptide repeat-containing protein [Nesterenkonia xinjiangensis]NYJ77194.1 uncharacterized protein YjbI with pentapeptide repeats [Nesterenkonia xinjiangensis]